MSYPSSLEDLHRYAPVEGEDVRVADFTSLQYELTVVEAVIGQKIAGAAASLKARLAQHMNDNGTWKKEAPCEDGPDGIGSRRYLSAIGKFNGTVLDAKGTNQLPASLFSESPVVVLASFNDATSSAFYSARGVFIVTDLTPAGIEFQLMNEGMGGGSSLAMRALTVSALETIRDDLPLGAPPWRAGGVIKVDY